MAAPSKHTTRKKNPRPGDAGAAIMPLRDAIYVACQNGLFVLPEKVLAALETLAPRKIVYLRQDEDSLTISPQRIPDGRRRELHAHYKVAMFRTATKLAIVDMKDSLRVMAVAWR
jgi:hypothetical protein